ncbi:hypothetical protein [Vibrio phage vB_VibM_10AMN]|uniref:Uncharacterized protein n=1 Tax=Staphylococcus phage vB_VibM_10AMN12 TaxID=3076785 RepID=A0AA96KSX5_9CAUD|nr:hypothetical protein [Vibrio phage vB_VibM_10AMN]WNO47436.1 hypothetical protein [Staphylococcus phage vB_VibM_10AMN12]
MVKFFINWAVAYSSIMVVGEMFDLTYTWELPSFLLQMGIGLAGILIFEVITTLVKKD